MSLAVAVKGRHFVLFRIGHDQDREEVIEILRLLHDAMDLPRHLPPTVAGYTRAAYS